MFHHHTATITPFSDNPDFDFEIRNVLGLAVGGGADPGEVLAAAAGIHCQPLARTLTAQRMFDWLDDQIGTPTGQD